VFIGSLHPSGNLFEERAQISLNEALNAHNNMRTALIEEGVPTVKIIEEVLKDADRTKLLDAAKKALEFHAATPTDREDLISSEYERLDHMTNEELFDILILQPRVSLVTAEQNTPFVAEPAMRPLSNLVFTRDQQIVTAKGLILGALNSPQRAPEVSLLKLVWETLGIPIAGQVENPGKLEGGDFIPISKELCLVGVGLRSNIDAVNQLMENDLFGTEKVAVIVDEYDKSQDRMHLDTVFNIVDKERVVILEDIIGESNPKRRMVNLYTRKDGKYTLDGEPIEFSNFLKNLGYNLITVTNDQQLQYICNFVNLGPTTTNSKGVILSVNKDLEELLVRNGYEGKVRYVDYRGITKMYGAAHCTTQVFRRQFPTNQIIDL
jgi:arginine deiminase